MLNYVQVGVAGMSMLVCASVSMCACARVHMPMCCLLKFFKLRDILVPAYLFSGSSGYLSLQLKLCTSVLI